MIWTAAGMVAVSALQRASSELPRWWRSRWKAVVVVASLALFRAEPVQRGDSDRDAALRRELARRDLLFAAAHEKPHWVDGPTAGGCTFGGSRVALRARRAENEPHDVYLARVQLSPEGYLLRVCGAHNLTETALADETDLRGNGPRLSWQLRAQEQTYRLEYADLRGERAPSEFGWLARWQWRATRLERTGQWSGVSRRSFRLEPAQPNLSSLWTAKGFELHTTSRRIEIPTEAFATELGTRAWGDGALIEEPRTPAMPGSVLTWAVDRARAMPGLGTEGVQWLKAVGFGALDRLETAWAAAAPPSSLAESELADAPAEARGVPGAPRVRDPGFPPAPVPPLREPALPGEGEWRSLEGDPFVRAHAGLPPAFTTTFLRPDPRREAARVVVVLWDPRRLELHFMAGTEEPRSATGAVSSGIIPRDPALLSRLAGAFNGGFQTTHGAYGAQVSRQLLVPPRPYAATIVSYEDGAVGFGTWPLDDRVPAGIDSFRQNLTPLVAEGSLNPYRRKWWGGVPLGWDDTTRTVRSALCLTRENYLGYFYGSRVDHEALGRALLMVRCQYGVHLDMNAGHTGFEFYSVLPQSSPTLPREQLVRRWKAEAPVPELPGLRYRARRLFQNMQLMHFPRYIRRQSRDFFYLTERPLLPGPAPEGANDEADAWQVRVPSDGTFPAIVTTANITDLAREGVSVQLLELDLKWVSPRLGAASPAPPDSVLSVALPTAAGSGRALWIANRRARIGTPAPNGQVLAREHTSGQPRAAWGIRDGQILVYAQVSPEASAETAPALLDAALTRAGARERMFVTPLGFARIGGSTELTGRSRDAISPARTEQAALHFVRDAWQALRAPFTDTEIVGPETWQPHQP